MMPTHVTDDFRSRLAAAEKAAEAEWAARQEVSEKITVPVVKHRQVPMVQEVEKKIQVPHVKYTACHVEAEGVGADTDVVEEEPPSLLFAALQLLGSYAGCCVAKDKRI
ncbi:unnamed protein product [Symbiodinium natans]|uniref:Uncharacterized protein n=1 Tax=Symbiodinium natans TaxID=878477 RepID=A0A812MGJ2_9DINO|nr:unnamed protein product [Symbiodinium natans]